MESSNKKVLSENQVDYILTQLQFQIPNYSYSLIDNPGCCYLGFLSGIKPRPFEKMLLMGNGKTDIPIAEIYRDEKESDLFYFETRERTDLDNDEDAPIIDTLDTIEHLIEEV